MILYQKDTFISCCDSALEEFVEGLTDINYVFIATSDGFPVASKIIRHDDTYGGDDKLAAVSSSIMALGVSLATELGLKDCRTVSVDSVSGKILLRPIITQQLSFIILVQTGSQSLLGYILHSMEKLEKAIVTSAIECCDESLL